MMQNRAIDTHAQRYETQRIGYNRHNDAKRKAFDTTRIYMYNDAKDSAVDTTPIMIQYAANIQYIMIQSAALYV